MKYKKKSALILVVAIAMALSLSACADTKWPTWLTGEPGDDVLNAPRVVGKPANLNQDLWPNLADVPAKPKDYTPPKTRQDYIDQMNAERTESATIKQQVMPQANTRPVQP